MGVCAYCGHDAGFLKNHHKLCQQNHKTALENIKALVDEAIESADDFAELAERVVNLAEEGRVQAAELPPVLISAWTFSVEKHLSAEGISAEVETRLAKFRNWYSLSEEDLEKNGAYTKLVKAGALRDISEDKVPARVLVDGLSINLIKAEKVVWFFNGVSLYEDKVFHKHVGTSHGVSVRVGKGLYYRTGEFHGRTIDSIRRVEAARGSLTITDKHIYFTSETRDLRIPYPKIISFTPYNDGVGVNREAGKTEIFVTGDGWFTYNLLMGLARMASGNQENHM